MVDVVVFDKSFVLVFFTIPFFCCLDINGQNNRYSSSDVLSWILCSSVIVGSQGYAGEMRVGRKWWLYRPWKTRRGGFSVFVEVRLWLGIIYFDSSGKSGNKSGVRLDFWQNTNEKWRVFLEAIRPIDCYKYILTCAMLSNQLKQIKNSDRTNHNRIQWANQIKSKQA